MGFHMFGFNFIYWIIFIILILFLINFLFNNQKNSKAKDILDERLAKGEIDKEEYKRLLKEIERD